MTHEELIQFRGEILEKSAWAERTPQSMEHLTTGIFLILCEIMNELQNQRRSPLEQKDL